MPAMRLSAAFLTSVILAGMALGQQRSITFIDPSDPFRLDKGTTFAASTGKPELPAAPSRISQIAGDIREAERVIAENYASKRPIDIPKLTKGSLEGMLHMLDPHSNFYDRSEWKELLDEQRSGYSGIGVTIAAYRVNGKPGTFVMSVMPDSPSAAAGLRFGDRILAINGEDVSEMSSDEVRDRIRGSIGTSLKMTVERAGSLIKETLFARRGRVPQPSIPDWYMLAAGVGYIDLSEGFNYTTSEELDRALRELKRAGMRSLLLDLRGNGGGILDQAVKVAERFLPSGTEVLSQRGRGIYDNRDWRSNNPAPETIPLVVIVNSETASASEVLAGALQDNDRALIIGERTFGKGLVQSVIDLPSGTGLTLTTARYLTPSGRSIQRHYSTADLYDYFNHKETAAGIDKPFFEARTVTGRRVFGGDGILPDRIVGSDKLTSLQASLLDAIFQAARDFAAARAEGTRTRISGTDRRTDVASIALTDDQFRTSLDAIYRAQSGSVTFGEIISQSKFIRRRLEYHLAMAAFGATPALQVLIANDPQITAALDALPQAAQLNNDARLTRR